MAVTKQIILIDCTDEVGLIHRVTEVLYRHGLNVEDQKEFVRQDNNRFFMRTEFSGKVTAAVLLPELERQLPPGAAVRFSSGQPKKVVVLAATEPYCLGELLLRHEFGELHAEIQAVVSNHESLRDLVGKFGIPFFCRPHEERSREQHEAEISELLAGWAVDYLVLAKYMRILSPELVGRYAGRIINIHHSFLPAFVGARPYQQAFDRGVKIIGATAHFVTADLDEGPIIAQDVIPVTHNMTAADMRRAGRDVEKLVLARALRLLFEDRVFIDGRRTVVFE